MALVSSCRDPDCGCRLPMLDAFTPGDDLESRLDALERKIEELLAWKAERSKPIMVTYDDVYAERLRSTETI